MGFFSRIWQGRRKYVSVLVIIACIVLVRLGFWQLDRHTQRAARNAVIDARINAPAVPLAQVLAMPSSAQEYRHVTVVCAFQTSRQILWRNRSYQGTTGYQILTICQPDSGAAILVNRGWIPYQDGLGDWATRYAPPSTSLQTITGVWRLSQEPSPTTAEADAVNGWRERWFTITIPAIATQMHRELVPGFVELQPEAGVDATSYPIRTAISDLGMGSHLGYAIQWFSFAVIVLVGALVVAYRRPV